MGGRNRERGEAIERQTCKAIKRGARGPRRGEERHAREVLRVLRDGDDDGE